MSNKFLDFEIRAEDFEGKEEGVFSGKVCDYNSVDSYGTRFQFGCFKKTLEERFIKNKKIKLLFNHDFESLPLGTILKLEERKDGLFFEAKLDLNIERSRDIYSLLKSGALNTMSFGFRPISSKMDNDVEVFTEVRLGEISIVLFEANENATIEEVRKIEELKVETMKEEEKEEKRSTDFYTNLNDKQFWSKRWQSIYSLEEALEDQLWFSDKNELEAQAIEAIDAFKAEYVGWINEYVNRNMENERSENIDELAFTFRKYLKEKELNLNDICVNTRLNKDDVVSLKRGQYIDQNIINSLDNEVLSELNENKRNKEFDNVLNYLKENDLTEERKELIAALISNDTSKIEDLTEVENDEAVRAQQEALLILEELNKFKKS